MGKSIDKEKNIIDNGYEMRAEDLIVVRKNRKSAIFNKETSEFVTEHLYDEIILSDSGNHVVYIGDEMLGEITYSAIINNQGQALEFPNLVFEYYSGFNMFNRSIAKCKETDKKCIVDNNGNILSEQYDRISKIDNNYDFGVYYAANYYPLEEFGRGEKDRKILNFDGREIKLTIFDDGEHKEVKVLEFKDIDNIELYIRNFGPSLISLIPRMMFKEDEIYPRIIKAVNVFAKHHPMLKKVMISAIELLEKMVSYYRNNKEYNVQDLYPEKFHASTQIEVNDIKKKIKNLYQRLNLI